MTERGDHKFGPFPVRRETHQKNSRDNIHKYLKENYKRKFRDFNCTVLVLINNNNKSF